MKMVTYYSLYRKHKAALENHSANDRVICYRDCAVIEITELFGGEHGGAYSLKVWASWETDETSGAPFKFRPLEDLELWEDEFFGRAIDAMEAAMEYIDSHI